MAHEGRTHIEEIRVRYEYLTCVQDNSRISEN